MNIAAPTGECLQQLMVLVSNEKYPYVVKFTVISVSTTFAYLKNMVWEKAAFMGMAEKMGDSNHYHWEFVNKDGEVDSVLVMDEAAKPLSEINWSVELDSETPSKRTTTSSLAVLRLVPTPDAALHVEQMKINKLIGTNMERQRFDLEVRSLSNDVCAFKLDHVNKRNAASAVDQLMMDHPPSLLTSTYSPPNGLQSVILKIRVTETHETMRTVRINQTAAELIMDVIEHHNTRNYGSNLEPSQYVLKVVGRKQYLAGDTIVCNQRDIRFYLESQRSCSFPVLLLVSFVQPQPLPPPSSGQALVRQRNPSAEPNTTLERSKQLMAFTSQFEELLVTLSAEIRRVEGGEEKEDELLLIAGIAHGSAFLTPCKKIALRWLGPTPQSIVQAQPTGPRGPAQSFRENNRRRDSSRQRSTPKRARSGSFSVGESAHAALANSRPTKDEMQWVGAEPLVIFEDIKLSEVPRSARLCFALLLLTPRSAPRHLGWVNVPVFDHEAFFNDGQHTLYMWPSEDYVGPRCGDPSHPWGQDYVDQHYTTSSASSISSVSSASFSSLPHLLDDNVGQFCRPLSIPGSNPSKEGPCLKLSLQALNSGAASTPTQLPRLRYPSLDMMIELANTLSSPPDVPEIDVWHLSRMEALANSDVLTDIVEQDKEFLWRNRFSLLTYPLCLPRLHQCVNWRTRVSVAQYYSLLKGWPHDADPLNAGMPLELLHHTFPDQNTREFAVARGLAMLDDQMIVLCLPQIIQCLKYEAYVESELAKMVLKRAVVDPDIGNALYYHMRAEMRASACVAHRFGSLLNIYFLCCKERTDALYRQSLAFERLALIQRCLRVGYNVEKEFRQRLGQWQQTFCDLGNPLFVDITLHVLLSDSCKVFDSKMRPFMLRWASEDVTNDQSLPGHSVIYKIGDDLRQDVLTVQILHMMELVWERHGLPLRLYPYRVLSFGPREGFIETIWEAETVASIRRKRPASSSSTNYLLIWLQQHAEKRRAIMSHVVEQFARTCAAYCVATYVLGIGDRHHDNIMVTQSGQLYHIDFGHFLGNYKRINLKFMNIAREYVSFLFVEEFKYVITNGDKDEEGLSRFRKLCLDGFMALRKNANLFLVLFLGMTAVGMPELSSPDNLEFLRSRLCLDKSDAEAKEAFQQKMIEDDTFLRKLAVKTNWAAHDIAHKK